MYQENTDLRYLINTDYAWPPSKILDYTGSFNSNRKFFVEIGKGGITGCISVVFRNNNIVELTDFYIIEGAEDSGIRDTLLARAMNYCKKRNVEKIKAKIFPDLKSYFKNRGFQAERRLRDYFRPGEDILVVSKFLHRK